MGGAGYIFTGEHDADVMHNSAQINLNMLEACRTPKFQAHLLLLVGLHVPRAYPEGSRTIPNCAEDNAYPAAPDSEYGWEKLFSERLYLAYARNHGFTVRIARYHNIFGPEGAWNDGREKAPAALCRKVAEASEAGEVQIWGDGEQTRSFLYIDECLEGSLRLMRSECGDVLNVGSDEMVSINALVAMIAGVADKAVRLKHIPGPLGVRGRNSDNHLIAEKLGWRPREPLIRGIEKTYPWIAAQVAASTQRRGVSA